jgi:hypothetical protein
MDLLPILNPILSGGNGKAVFLMTHIMPESGKQNMLKLSIFKPFAKYL